MDLTNLTPEQMEQIKNIIGIQEVKQEIEKTIESEEPFLVHSPDNLTIIGNPNQTKVKLADYSVESMRNIHG